MKTLRWIAGLAILVNGVEHLNVSFLDEPHEYLEEYRHIGFLMVLGAFLSMWAGIRILRASDPWAWLLGAALSVGMGVSLILSRTVGLLGFQEGGYTQEAFRTFAYEVVYLGAFLAAVRRAPEILTAPLRLGRARAATGLAADRVANPVGKS